VVARGPRSALRLIALAAVPALLLADTQRLSAGAPTEYQVKAAFLFNFAKFVEWPAGAFESAEAPIVIGVLGDDPFGRALDDAIDGKTIGGRRLVARRFTRVQESRGAHVLFVSTSEAPRLRQVLAGLAGASAMTVGDAPRFAEQGGVAGFLSHESKVRFCINRAAEARAGLKIGSQLLKLATLVTEDPEK